MSPKSLFKRTGRIGFIVQIQTATCPHKIDCRTIRHPLVPQQVSLKKISSPDYGKNRLGDLTLAVADGQARLTVTMQRVGVGSSLKAEYGKVWILPVRKINRTAHLRSLSTLRLAWMA